MAYDHKKMFSISGKHVIMIDGARRLPRGMVEGFLENGCKVVLTDIQGGKLEAVCEEYRAMGYEAYEICGNLSDRADVDRIFIEAIEILDGKLGVLTPAAGIQGKHLLEEFPIEKWDLVLNINLNVIPLTIQKIFKAMLKQVAGGKIITIDSMVIWSGGATVPAYTASKGAVFQLTKSLAIDCAGRSININYICPGCTGIEICANTTRERGDECTVHIPAGRWGTPENLKGPVLFLTSSVSDYLNGTTIPVNGGRLVE